MELEVAREILGIGSSGSRSPGDLRKTFRELCFLCHPDKAHDTMNSGIPSALLRYSEQDRFSKLVEAYELLTQPQKSKAYEPWSNAIIVRVPEDCDTHGKRTFQLLELGEEAFALVCRCGAELFLPGDEPGTTCEVIRIECQGCSATYKCLWFL